MRSYGTGGNYPCCTLLYLKLLAGAAGRCVLVEGQHLHIAVVGAQQALPQHSAEVQEAARHVAAEGAELRPVPDPPLVLYCIQANVLQAEKLRPMFSTPDVGHHVPLSLKTLPASPLCRSCSFAVLYTCA